MTDPAGTVTVYRYDALNRRVLVVQGYRNTASQYTDPADWSWNGTAWEDGAGTPVTITHGTDNAENIIVQVTYDIAGRMTQLRDPRGNPTGYQYDTLGRRTKLTNLLNDDWETAYTEVNGAQRNTLTYPGLECWRLQCRARL